METICCWTDPAFVLFRAEIAITPVTKGRPRVGNGHAYTPETTKVYEDKLGWLLKAAGARPTTALVGLHLVFHTTKTGDIDNFVKSALDSMQGRRVRGVQVPGILFANDSQVRKVCVEMVADRSDRIDVVMYRHQGRPL